MLKLHIRQDQPVNGFYPIRLTLKKAGQADLEAEASIEFGLTEQEQNDLRWYLEDYLQRGGATEAIVAQQVESFIQTRGEELYEKVLAANNDTRALWYAVRNELADLRVEVTTGIAEAASIPWELMRDPKLNSPISLRVKSFVRVQSNPNISFVSVPLASDGRVRLLYVASRPGGAGDVELRAVANRLLRDLGHDRSRFYIKALRPPTFEELRTELNDARQAGRPYHIVHFDGHGTYEDLSKTTLAHWTTAGDEGRKRGYLLFEHPGEDRVRPVDGDTLGKLLHDAGVPVLVLNACQSAMHEAKNTAKQVVDVHDEVRAIGSLAQAVIDQGVPAVLGMRYSVFVVTAAQYIGELYAALAKGRSFGQAATEGRKDLQQDPKRWIGLEPHPLQDWFVPVAYEAGPIELLSSTQSVSFADQTELEDPVQNNRALLRYIPEEGFVGRDETLLALDRAFDDHRVVLLHAYAGQGKSSTAVEFARWYALTGGLGAQPVVLLASFESYTDLDDLLNQIAQPFSPLLERQNIHWGAINEPEKRRSLVMKILRSFPILWIWDNVETVAGFPEGTESQWTIDEQNELRDFLKQIKLDDASQVRILLTSRRDEQRWLGGVPHRIEMGRMRNSDAARLARNLGKEKNLSSFEIADWQPLLDYCAGNPLTLRVLVGQAVKARLRGKQQIEDFVEAIRSGEQSIEDTDEKEGRDKSLGASLSYGFRNAFKDDELPIIALLHLFQGTVDVDVLQFMGSGIEPPLPELEGLSKEALTGILERATAASLVTHLYSTWYSIHPALPWYLRQLFAQHYNDSPGHSSADVALGSWVKAMGALANYYNLQFKDGTRGVVDLLELEEDNLLHARRMALKKEWWNRVPSCMEGLRVLYNYQGRNAEWARLVEEVRPHYCDANNDPVPGREDGYTLVVGYCVHLARLHERNLAKAAALQQKLVVINRDRAASALSLPHDAVLDDMQRGQLRTLGVSIEMLGHIQRQSSQAKCVQSYEEAIGIYKRIKAVTEEAVLHYNIGIAHKDIPEILDLDAAENSYKKSLELRPPHDALGRARCIMQIGVVHRRRMLHAIRENEPVESFIQHAQLAEKNLLEALKLCPKDAYPDLAPIHNSLGNLYNDLGQFDRARHHYELDAQCEAESGNRYGAGQTRVNMALMYARISQDEKAAARRIDLLKRAHTFAEAALRDFQSYEGRAAEDETLTRQLIDDIGKQLANTKGQ